MGIQDKKLNVVGHGVHVKDAVEKVTGTLKYGVDLATANMTYGKILRAPHPHCKIISIDTTKAEKLPGVLGV